MWVLEPNLVVTEADMESIMGTFKHRLQGALLGKEIYEVIIYLCLNIIISLFSCLNHKVIIKY